MLTFQAGFDEHEKPVTKLATINRRRHPRSVGIGLLAAGRAWEEMSPPETGAQTVQRDPTESKAHEDLTFGGRSLWCRTQNGLELDMPSESPGGWVPPAPVRAVTVTMSLV